MPSWNARSVSGKDYLEASCRWHRRDHATVSCAAVYRSECARLRAAGMPRPRHCIVCSCVSLRMCNGRKTVCEFSALLLRRIRSVRADLGAPRLSACHFQYPFPTDNRAACAGLVPVVADSRDFEPSACTSIMEDPVTLVRAPCASSQGTVALSMRLLGEQRVGRGRGDSGGRSPWPATKTGKGGPCGLHMRAWQVHIVSLADRVHVDDFELYAEPRIA